MLAAFLYEVEPSAAAAFERTYGPDGAWATFFRGDPAYLGTALHRAQDDPPRFLVLDSWTSPAAHAAFLDRHRAEYDRRSAETASLYRTETPLGHFGAAPPAVGLELQRVPGTYAACRLEPRAPVPAWARGDAFLAVTRTDEELSIVCPDEAVPPGVEAERGWSCLRVAGPLDFALTGVAAALATPLAAAGISILLVATYDTDYLLVREAALERAVAALALAGHRVSPD